MSDSIVFARPAKAARLMLLFHGVGSNAASLRPLGEALARAFGDALVVGIDAPFASDLGSGRQWFSVRGIDEHNRVPRVAEALPHFIATVKHWQHEAGLDAAATTLLGFSQGAIMSLAATQQPEPLCSSVVAIAGRFVQAPQRMPWSPAVHLLHGTEDRVMPLALSRDGIAALHELGHADATLDVFDGLAHGIDARVLARVVERLRPAPG